MARLNLQYKNIFSEGDLLRLLNYLNKSFQELRFTQNQKLKIEVSLTHLVGLEKSSTISEIISKVNNINIEQADNPDNYQQAKKKSIKIEEPKPEIRKEIPIFKEPPSPPRIKEESKPGEEPQRTSPLDYEFILSKWDGFVDIVSNEKPLILGPVMQNAEVQNFEGNKLNLTCIDKDGKFLLKSHKDYIEKKALDYFGKKIHFGFTETETKKPTLKKEGTRNIPETKTTVENSPIINKIISEFGGQEIK